MALLLATLAPPSRATELEKLLMPGALAADHADLEADCGECHDRSDRGRQRQLCLDCHDKVAADVAAKAGFHGRAVGTAQCSTCHSEHKGRNADIVRFTPEAFDHARTDFRLDGAHAAVPCAACHARGRKYRDAPRACIDCHRNDDAHGGKLGTDCADCHGPVRFGETKFDHASTRFALKGAHAEAPCFACHRDPSLKGAPGRCVDCHAEDDVHRGSRGPACGDCHGVSEWQMTRFDHKKASGYALLGRHAKLACDGCHRGGDLKAELPRECSGCHAASDVHSGRFGADCAGCHGSDRWVVAAFDHEQRSKFALRGAHAKLACHACHTGVIEQQQMAKDCIGCHAVDDAHKGSMGRDCGSCHRESGWRDQVRFDHDLSKFPLVGLHVSVPCEECHASRAYRDAPERCVDCHRAKDVHQGRLKDDCAACHNPNGWDFWQFDHDSTRFRLTGAHERLGCRDCHRKPDHDLRQSGECASCHRADDVHDGQFGRDCGRCHGTASFKQVLTH
jgi:hypothetical protein